MVMFYVLAFCFLYGSVVLGSSAISEAEGYTPENGKLVIPTIMALLGIVSTFIARHIGNTLKQSK
jgi:hypothetical protein